MAVYIMLTKLTNKGAETLKGRPDRLFEVDRELEEMGVHVREQYATLGEYDFVNIVEAPDNLTAERVSIELGSRGTLQIETLPGIPVSELVSGLTGGARTETYAAY